MGSAWRSGPYWRLSCRFSCFAALFRAFSAAPRRPEGPHSRVFCQPGKKTLQRGPLVAFSAANLLFGSFLPTFGAALAASLIAEF